MLEARYGGGACNKCVGEAKIGGSPELTVQPAEPNWQAFDPIERPYLK